MKILEETRYYGFWLIDALKGFKLRNHLNDVSFILNNYDSKEAQSKRALYLEKIIQHATATTEFYKTYQNNTSLETFPVINKNILRKNKTKFYSNVTSGKKYATVTTGSTGTPLKIFHNRNKKLRNLADVIYFSKLANFKIGFKLLYLKKWSAHLKKSFFLSQIQNIQALEVLKLDRKYIINLISKLKKDPSNKVWIGYPSAYEVICRYLDRIDAKPVNANIKSIIAISEGLNSYTKKSMNYYFNAPVVSRYSNMENGILAQQIPNTGNDFVINWASYFIEILEFDSDTVAKPGEPGRIVITDLFNYYMPLIRYDTGDIGTIDTTVSPPVFKNIDGRKTDAIFNTRGNVVTSMIIECINKYEGIIQGQLIQEDLKEYTLKLNILDSFSNELEIVKEFKNYLGIDAAIKVIYVNEIPLLESGKRRATVNNYIKNSLT